MITERLQLLKSGDKKSSIPALIFDKICDGLKALEYGFESNSGISDPLETIIDGRFYRIRIMQIIYARKSESKIIGSNILYA